MKRRDGWRWLVPLMALWMLSPDVLAQRDACVSVAKQENRRCWDECEGGRDVVEACTEDCDAAYEAATRQCTTTDAAAKPQLYGTKKGGQDGCYFGECPDDLKDRIENADEQPAEEPVPPRRRQPPVPTVSEPASQPPVPAYPQVQMTQICQTAYFWCVMNQYGPINSPCWCAGPYGIASGITVPQR